LARALDRITASFPRAEALSKGSSGWVTKIKIVEPHGPGKRRRSGRQTETVKDFAEIRIGVFRGKQRFLICFEFPGK